MPLPEAERVIRLARDRGVRVAVAESLTGGLVAAALVDVPGSSLAFSGGVVAYDSELKRSVLGVESTLIAERGPVDSAVARQMAQGVRRVCAVPGHEVVGVATTGVAGPDPDPQTGLVAGTVWLGVSSLRGESDLELRLTGSRSEIRSATVLSALRVLGDELERLG